uniref:Protein Wnt n=1 Tax=Hemicentrotus pulcherrimus TaxID=7650 RepID=A0A1L7NTK2_HEMPU|nr:wnt6 protein [Hemicentrotus pulcherrimus]
MEWTRLAIGLVIFLVLPPHIIGLWWAVGSPLNFDPNRICRRSRKLRGSSKQRDICLREPEIVQEVVRGTKLGMLECQFQLRHHRWNCTTMHNSFIKVIRHDTRQTAFVNAITTAGVTYAATQACSMGKLHQCGCANLPSGRNELDTNEAWVWGGCGDNVEYGYTKSKEFVDAHMKRRSDIGTLVTLHNNEAGRLSIAKHMRRECKCHGLSGSCTLKTCWKKMPTFRDVGNRLKSYFDGAVKVTGGNSGENLIPEDDTVKQPTIKDLVYSMESHDFCEPDRKSGSLGTEGRRCNSTSMDVGGCDIMCCGRGYHEVLAEKRENCRCRFHWCCVVNCETCRIVQTIQTCNGYNLG